MLKKNKLYFWILEIFIVLDGFVLYGSPQRYLEYFFSIIVFIIFMLDPYFRRNLTKDKYVAVAAIAILCLSFLQIVLSRYGFIYSWSTTFLLIVSLGSFYYDDMKKVINGNRNKIFNVLVYITMFGSLLYQFCRRITEDPSVVNNIYEIYYSLGRDKNVLGIIVFFFFVICFKRKSKIGIIFCVAFAGILNSRMLVMGLIIFVISYIFRHQFFSFWNKIFNKKYWLAFLMSFVFVAGFSVLFVGYCNTNGIGEYQKTWADGSNYIRMTSNLYALNKTIDDPYFVFSGSDNYIFQFLGISENVRFLGERVVQPHNDIINLYVRCGLIYSLLYWGLMGKLFQRVVQEDNIYIFLPFFFMSMFIRPIFVGPQLLFVLYALILDDGIGKLRFKIKNVDKKNFE